MTVEPIGIIAVIIGLIGFIRPPEFLICAFLISTLLGAAAAFNVSAIGGVSIPPAHLLFGFLTLRLLGSREIRQRASEAVAVGRPGFWLLLALVWSLLSAYFMPRLFAGETFVFPVRAQAVGVAPLEPSTSNVTQSVYFIADVTCFLVLSGYAATKGGIRFLLSAGLAVAIADLVFAALDWITYLTNTGEVLAIIRNANYTMRVEDQVGGLKRTVGSFVEASSFGSVTVGYFAFTLRLWFLGIYPRLTLTLTLLALSATLLATSTTAYVGLAAYLLLIYLELVIRFISRPVPFQMRLFVLGAPLMLSILVLAIALSDSYSGMLQDLLDTFFFGKLSSDSGVERSAWNRTALQGFFDTYGFGFGNGSGRASSFVVAALANLGLFGSALLVMFLMGLFVGPRNAQPLTPIEDAARQSAKSMCLAWLIASAVSNPLIDLGLAFYSFAALACAQAFRLPSQILRPWPPSGHLAGASSWGSPRPGLRPQIDSR
jgi:hypothetical protein